MGELCRHRHRRSSVSNFQPTIFQRRLEDPYKITDDDTDMEERLEMSLRRRNSKPKLKLKLSEKAAALAPGMSFLGPYDRELDSDDEELAFEEQFILRMPAGEDCEKLRKMVQSREIGNDVWFKFRGELLLSGDPTTCTEQAG